MKKIIILALLSLLLWSIPAFGSQWIVYATFDKGQHSFDKESIVKKNKLVTVWSKTVYSSPEYDVEGKKMDEELWQHEINCSERTQRYLSFTIRFSDGTSRSEKANSITYQAIPPDSLGDRLLMKVCK